VGFAADHVRSLELVTADGRIRTVSPAQAEQQADRSTASNASCRTLLAKLDCPNRTQAVAVALTDGILTEN
jgi:FAD/FMN-containing dehydrogenase